MPRLYLPGPIEAGEFSLPDATVRHLQALRLRVGAALTLFDGRGGEWVAQLVSASPRARVQVLAHVVVERELPWDVELVVGMPANERMDWLVEKAVELGAARVRPLMTARTVLRLHGERAERRAAHWRAIAVAACEQCGRNQIPHIAAPMAWADWLGTTGARQAGEARCLLALPGPDVTPDRASWAPTFASAHRLVALSGPEGGLDDAEIDAAVQAGFSPLNLGSRILRAETAPLAWLAALGSVAR